MSLYRQYAMDTNVEKDGVLLNLGTTDDGKMITMRIARAGGANQKFNKTVEAVLKPYRRQIQTDTIDRKLLEKLIHEVFAKAVVLGWENVQDADGNDLDFTYENVMKIFSDLPEVFTEVQEAANKSSLFRAMVREADAGN